MSCSDWVDFAAIKAAVSIQSVLDGYRIPGLRRSGMGQLRGPCPLHGRGGEDAFHVSLGKHAFRCFYCQAQGNVLDLVAALESCSVRQAALRLQQRLTLGGGQPAVLDPATQLVPKKETGNAALPFWLRRVDWDHGYLRQRGMARETAQYFGVGFYAGPGMMSGRLVIPVHDEAGRLVAYCGRSLDGRSPRYKLPFGFRKSLVLFNLYRAAATGHDTVVVVEGFFDCMRIHQSGFPGVVALMGTSLSAAQQKLLLGRFRHIVLLLDGDRAGRAGSACIAERLAGRCSVTIMELDDNEQPDQLAQDEIRRLLKPLALECTSDAE